jgi:hypothetical protein
MPVFLNLFLNFAKFLFVIFLQKLSFRDAKLAIADSGGNNFAKVMGREELSRK